jgi:hypothetical protein
MKHVTCETEQETLGMIPHRFTLEPDRLHIQHGAAVDSNAHC